MLLSYLENFKNRDYVWIKILRSNNLEIKVFQAALLLLCHCRLVLLTPISIDLITMFLEYNNYIAAPDFIGRLIPHLVLC